MQEEYRVPYSKTDMKQPAGSMGYFHRFESVKQNEFRQVFLIIAKRYSKREIKNLVRLNLAEGVSKDILRHIERHAKERNIIAYQHYLSQFDNVNQGEEQ